MNRAELLKALRDTAQSASNAIAGNVSGPVDLIAAALRAGGLDIQQPVGGSEWMQKKGFTAPVEMGAPRIIGETLGMAGPAVVAAKAPQIAAGLNRAGANLAAPRTLHPQKGAIVWHGSPHKFDKFDSSKIGTGEGAQAYGHGLYLAESPEVAKSYAQAGDAAAPVVKNWLAEADDAGIPASQSYQWARNEIANRLSKAKSPGVRATLSDALARFDELVGGGNTYKVDLPDDAIAKMLDWDKPLSQQAPEVQQTLKSLVDDVQSGGFDLSRGNRDLRKAFNPVTREQVLQEIATEYPHLKIVDGGLVEKSGRRIPDVAITEWMQNKHGAGYQDAGQLYRDLAHIVGSDAQVSATLKNNGIPGIRYLDGGSRGAGQGTSNFVVFPGNESMLKIIERNGQPLGLMGVK